MGFGFGPGSDMMKAYKSNKRQLNKGKSLKDSYGNDTGQRTKLKFKEATE